MFQLGIIAGFLIPPYMVEDNSNVLEIGKDILSVFYLSAGYNVAVFIVTVLCK